MAQWVAINSYKAAKRSLSEWANTSWRQVIAPQNIPTTGTKVRFTFQAPAAFDIIISDCFVGVVDGWPDLDFKSTPTRVTFGGNNGVTIPAGTTIVTDEITFAYDPGNGDGLAVSWYNPFTGSNAGAGYGRTGVVNDDGMALGYSVGNNVAKKDGDPGHWDTWAFYYAPNDMIGLAVIKTEIYSEDASSVIANFEFDWNILSSADYAEVSKYSAYSIVHQGTLAEVSKYSAYSIVHQGTLAEVSKYSIYVVSTAAVYKTVDLLWNIQSTDVTADYTFLWNIEAGDVIKQCTFLWNVAGAPIPFIKTFQFLWDILGPLEKTFTFKWHVLDGTPAVVECNFLWNVYAPPAPPVNYFITSFSFNWNVEIREVDPSRVVYPDIPITERWTFKTSIFRSRSGKEQRRSYYPNPVISMQYSALVLNNKDFRDLRQAVEIDTTAFYPVPEFQYYAFLDRPTEPNDTRLYFDPVEVNPVVGGYLGVCNDTTFETRFIKIAAVHSDGCTLALPVGIVANRNTGFVCPVRICRISTDGNSKLAPVHAQSTYLFVSVDRDRDFLRAGYDPNFTRMNGSVILDRPIVADVDVNEDYLSGNDVIDNGLAAPNLYVNEPTRRRFDLTYRINRLGGASDIDWWRAFALETCGQWKPFVLPTYRADADVAASPALGASTLELAGSSTYEVFTQGGYAGLMFDTPNGREYRHVDGVSLLGANTLCELSSPIGTSVGDNDFDVVSYMMLVRLAEDEITLVHGATTRLIQFKAQMTTV